MFDLRCAVILFFALVPMLRAQCPNTCEPIYPAPDLPPEVGATYVWDYTTCTWKLVPCNGYNGCNSPIVIDTDGSGFHLTSAAGGVMFDFYGDGKPIQVAWTAKGSTNGWLALPKNGQITSARDLFGNITAQTLTNWRPPNGFAALAIYDTLPYGGNNNGVIDPEDKVWPSLRIWIDANHDGISQPGELHALEEFGIGRISLHYGESKRVDQYGNQFRYKGHLVPANDEDQVDRKIFDVILATQ
jgi:hypothetical protein